MKGPGPGQHDVGFVQVRPIKKKATSMAGVGGMLCERRNPREERATSLTVTRGQLKQASPDLSFHVGKMREWD